MDIFKYSLAFSLEQINASWISNILYLAVFYPNMYINLPFQEIGFTPLALY